MKNIRDVMVLYHKKIKVKNISSLRNKKIVITGATGLIGSNLISYLDYLNNKNNLNMKIVGIYRTKLEEWMPKSNNIRYLKMNLSKKKLPENMKFNYLIHAATYGQPKKVLENKLETVQLSTKALFNLLELSKKNKSKFLFVSSSEIYGEPDNKNLNTGEGYFGNVNTLSDRALYAESKRIAETICYSYKNSLDIKIVRTLIAYGPGVRYDDRRVIAEFIKKAQNYKIIEMMDRGLAKRTFCFIGDTIEMFLNILINGKDIVYNVSGKGSVSIKELANIIAKINRAKVSMPKKSYEISGTPKTSTISNKKYCLEFKKQNFISLFEGLRITSLWFNYLKNRNE